MCVNLMCVNLMYVCQPDVCQPVYLLRLTPVSSMPPRVGPTMNASVHAASLHATMEGRAS